MTDARWVFRAALAVISAAFVVLAACGGGGGDADETPDAPTATVAADVTPTTAPTPEELGYELEQAIPGFTLRAMLGFVMVPGSDDEALVLQQTGGMQRVSLSDGSSQRFADFGDLLIDDPQYEEGLLGLAFSPDFLVDGRAYVYYSAGSPRRGVLARFPVVDGVLDTTQQEVILEVEQPFANHNGGQLAFGPDGYLYLGLGDGGLGRDPQDNGQNLATLLGSIIRIDVSGDEGYEIPPDNPFVGTTGARPEIFAYGFRNPWRLSFDSVTGDLWAGDVGETEWEEVERVVAGGNYGWNVMEGPVCFAAASCDMTDLLLPRAAYDHGQHCAVIGGYVYHGEAMPELDGYYIYADFCSGNVWAVNTADESEEILLAESGFSITSFGVLPDGELVVTTFDELILKLQRREG